MLEIVSKCENQRARIKKIDAYLIQIEYSVFWYTEKISIKLTLLVFTNLQPSSISFVWGLDPADSDTCRWRHSDTWRRNGELQQIKARMDISGVFEKTNVSEHHQPSISYSAQCHLPLNETAHYHNICFNAFKIAVRLKLITRKR